MRPNCTGLSVSFDLNTARPLQPCPIKQTEVLARQGGAPPTDAHEIVSEVLTNRHQNEMTIRSHGSRITATDSPEYAHDYQTKRHYLDVSRFAKRTGDGE